MKLLFCIFNLSLLGFSHGALYENHSGAKQRSLVFVFDGSQSMGPFLEFFKSGANTILDTVSRTSDSPIANYVLVTYADPDVGPALVTTDREIFRAGVQNIAANISATVNIDCDEMTISAIKMAVENALMNSYVYVMTDACAKDYHLENKVVEIVQKKMIQVIFLLMYDLCLKDEEENLTYKVYEKIAKASSGQVFVMNKLTDVSKILNFVNTTIEENVVDLGTVVSPSGYKQTHKVEVDPSMKKISAVVSGKQPELYAINPSGKIVTNTSQVITTLDLTNIKAIEVLNPDTGEWTFVHGSSETHTLKYAGVSKLTFDYGFSRFKTENLLDTTSVPLQNARAMLLISVKDESDGFGKLDYVELVDTSDNVVANLTIRSLVNPDVKHLYETTPFLPPNLSFYIRIVGSDLKGNKIRRSSPTPVQPQMAGVPNVQLNVKEINAATNEQVKLICRAESLIPLYARWYKGSVPLQQDEPFMNNAVLEYVIEKTDKHSAGIYTCVASNDVGASHESLVVNVQGVHRAYQKYGEEVELKFDMRSM